MTRINDYMFTHTGFQLFPVSYICGNLEKTIKYSMHRISVSFFPINTKNKNIWLVRYCYNLYIYIYQMFI